MQVSSFNPNPFTFGPAADYEVRPLGLQPVANQGASTPANAAGEPFNINRFGENVVSFLGGVSNAVSPLVQSITGLTRGGTANDVTNAPGRNGAFPDNGFNNRFGAPDANFPDAPVTRGMSTDTTKLLIGAAVAGVAVYLLTR